MRNICVGITAIAVSVGVMSVAAQGRNFSGTWVIDSEKTMAAAPAGGGGAGGAMVARGTGGGGAAGGVVAAGGGGGAAVSARSISGGAGGGGGAVMVSSDTIVAMDASSFSLEQGGVKTSYPLNGTEVPVEVRGITGRAKASWEGDVLTITTTLDRPDGAVTSTAKWSMEGDSLVRETGRKTYYKRK